MTGTTGSTGNASAITYVQGDATAPQGKGVKVIAHVRNDLGGWGKGFVLALSPPPAGTGDGVPLPRTGCGWAGGKWSRVEPLISQRLTRQGVAVTVYDH
ncbi:hypothetical protein [Streptomyces sp. NPDC101393]|uniref:hypothetical protein n=1 Tax=Streptomyces sp. NPDC101393 TaxID=3366141 RepID=UPI00382186A0